MQPTLFDVGRAQLPPRVLVFASGVNKAREIRGFSLARIPVGFSAGHVRGEAIAELQRSELPLFADSGAFSEVALTAAGLGVVHPISHQGWRTRLSLYQLLAERHGSNLSAVVPDRVADQEQTLVLLARYRQQLRDLAKTGGAVAYPSAGRCAHTGDLLPARSGRRRRTNVSRPAYEEGRYVAWQGPLRSCKMPGRRTSAALERAWSRYVGSTVKRAVRTAAISATFSNAQIAQ